MTVAAGTFGVLYVTGSSSAATELAEANAAASAAADARRKAENARDEAEDRAAAAEQERDDAKATAQGLQACQQAAKDLLAAVTAPDADSKAQIDAGADALGRMADNCR